MQISKLPPRLRQITEIIVARGEATAAEVREALLPDQLTNASVRSMLRRLEAKGVLRHRIDGHRFVYIPAAVDDKVRRDALHRISFEYFGGSIEQVAKVARLMAQNENSVARAEECRSAIPGVSSI